MRMSTSDDRPPYLLSEDLYRLIADIASTIVPCGKDPLTHPGAREVGAINYIDSILLSAEEGEWEMLQDILSTIKKKAKDMGGGDFVSLTNSEKIELLKSMYERSDTKDAYLFLRSLCVEGFYSDYHDPWYDGVTAWELIGFGGPRISDIKKDWSFLRIYSMYNEGEGDQQ